MLTIARPHSQDRTDRQRTSRGQSLVELALILPILFLFLAAALDLGRIFYAHISLRNAAREGAMQAAKTPNSYLEDQACDTATNLVVCRVILEAKGGSVDIKPTDIDLSCSVSGCPDQANSTVTVTVRGSFTMVTPLLSAVFGGQTLGFSSEATAQILYLPDPVVASLPPAPVADFTVHPNPPTGDAPLPVQFTDTSTNATQWSWDFGDGGTSNEQHPTYTFMTTGTFTVTLTAINSTSADIEQVTVQVGGTSPSEEPSVAPSDEPCFNPPNLIGKTVIEARQAFNGTGFDSDERADLSTGPKGKVQAQNPDHTQCLDAAWQAANDVVWHYRPG